MNFVVDSSISPDTPTAEKLKSQTTTDTAALLAMPAGFNQYSVSSWCESMAGFVASLAPEFTIEANPSAGEEVTKLAAMALEQKQVISMTGPKGATVLQATHTDAASFAKQKLKVINVLLPGSRYRNIVTRGAPDVEDDDQKFNDISFHRATITVDYEASVDANLDPAARDAAITSMKALVPEKQTLWFGATTTTYWEVHAESWAEAEALLSAVREPKTKLADDAAYKELATQLPKELSALYLFDAKSTIEGLASYSENLGDAAAIPGMEFNPGKITVAAETKPATVGVGVLASAKQFRVSLFMPVGAFKVLMAVSQAERNED
jgi:hypothetical protein